MSSRATIAELLALVLVWVLVLSLMPGCEGKVVPLPQTAEQNETPPAISAVPATPASRGAFGGGAESADPPAAEKEQLAQAPAPAVKSLERPTRPINKKAIEAAGLHRLDGKHLILYTDLPVDEQIAELPKVFDAAFPQWCAYFKVDPAAHANWQMRGSLIGDVQKFAGTDLIPEDLPKFRNGFAREGELWLNEQPSDYYRRHLLLHEGTHGFMETLLGGCGPPWYMEGMAELLATHIWKDGKLTLNVMPGNKEDFSMLGRIKIVQEGTAKEGHPLPLATILTYNNRAHLDNDPYGWCWAAAAFLDRHPRYQGRFRKLPEHVQDAQFNLYFANQFKPDWRALHEEWQLFAGTLEHGQDVAATVIDFRPSKPLTAGKQQVAIDSAHGWQSSGVQLVAGMKYKLTASGRFQIAVTDRLWPCEAGGVTIRYYAGRPLGMLLGAMVDDTAKEPPAVTSFLNPFAIGLQTEYTPEKTGTLYLQLNDSAGERSDNAGQVNVTIATE